MFSNIYSRFTQKSFGCADRPVSLRCPATPGPLPCSQRGESNDTRLTEEETGVYRSRGAVSSWFDRSTAKIISRPPGLRGREPSQAIRTVVRGKHMDIGRIWIESIAPADRDGCIGSPLARPAGLWTGCAGQCVSYWTRVTVGPWYRDGCHSTQARRRTQFFINTAFLIQAGRGVILWILASLLAYPFAKFYHQPEVFPLVLVAGISALATGLTSGSVYTLTRHVKLGSLTTLRIGAEATGLVVSVLWAMVSPTAWALVVGRVTTETFFTVGTHPGFGDQSVSLRWDSAAARDIMAFGAGMLASSATYFLAGEAERLVVAKFIDLTLLGCFSLALSITAAATGAFARLANGVFYPMMASAVRDGSDPARRYRKVRLLLLTASVCAGVTFVGGGKWIVACPAGSKVCGYRLDFADLGSSCGYRVVYACHNATVVRLWNFQICGVWQHSEAGISRRRFDGGI